METLLDCGHPESPHSSITFGYGTDRHGHTSCYACCAAHDEATLFNEDRWSGYLTKGRDGTWTVSNWPGSYHVPARGVKVSTGYGFGGAYKIITGYFTGPDGRTWLARVQGNMDLAKCRKLKPGWAQGGKGHAAS